MVALVARRRDHGGHLRARRPRGHAGDRDRDPHDPRVLALRHRGDLRQDQGEHRVRRADGAARVHGRRRPVAEPDGDAVGQHVARRPAADPVAAAVRRRDPEGLRVRDVRRGRDRCLLVDLHRGAGAHGPARAAGVRGLAAARAAPSVRGRRRSRPRPSPRRRGRDQGDGRGRARPQQPAPEEPEQEGPARPSASGGSRADRADRSADPRRPGLPRARHRLQGHHAGARRPDRVLDDHRSDRRALRSWQRGQGRRDRGARVHPRRAGRLPLRRGRGAGAQEGEAAARDDRRGVRARVRHGVARDPSRRRRARASGC